MHATITAQPRPAHTTAPDVAELLTAAYARHQRRMRYTAYELLQDWDEADDAVQVTFERAWTYRATLHTPAGVASWLYRILRNHCFEQLRRWAMMRRVLRGEPLPLDMPLDADDPDGTTLAERVASPQAGDPDRAAVRARVRRVLARMPRPYVEALLLIDGAGWKRGRAATFGNLGGVSAVKMRVMRARDMFAWLWTHLDDPTAPARPRLRDLPHISRQVRALESA